MAAQVPAEGAPAHGVEDHRAAAVHGPPGSDAHRVDATNTPVWTISEVVRRSREACAIALGPELRELADQLAGAPPAVSEEEAMRRIEAWMDAHVPSTRTWERTALVLRAALRNEMIGDGYLPGCLQRRKQRRSRTVAYPAVPRWRGTDSGSQAHSARETYRLFARDSRHSYGSQ